MDAKRQTDFCDVLCRAADYLCELSSILEERSESFKSKRITKNKMQNLQSIRKSADKLLLLCGLSKKSIQLVENIVTSALHVSKVEANKERSSDSDPPKYHTFDNGSYKLRVSGPFFEFRNSLEKTLEQYLSAKVRATQLSSDELDKYPVYYNCQLYQQRKTNTELKKVKFISEDSEQVDTDVIRTQNIDKLKAKKKKTCNEDFQSSPNYAECDDENNLDAISSLNDNNYDELICTTNTKIHLETSDGNSLKHQGALNDVDMKVMGDVGRNTETVKPQKPVIKCVDINKLLDKKYVK